MPSDLDLSKLSHAEKDALIVALFARIEALEKRIEALVRPPKTPGNSGVPPSRGDKPHCLPGAKQSRKGHPGVGRALHPDPDRVVEAHLDACPHCDAGFPKSLQTPQAVYDRIELPPIRPDVTRVHLFGGRCSCCGTRAVATAPLGLAPGSPFGRSVEALVVYLHYAQAIGLTTPRPSA